MHSQSLLAKIKFILQKPVFDSNDEGDHRCFYQEYEIEKELTLHNLISSQIKDQLYEAIQFFREGGIEVDMNNYHLVDRSIYCYNVLEFEKSRGRILKMKSDRWTKLYRRGQFPYKVVLQLFPKKIRVRASTLVKNKQIQRQIDSNSRVIKITLMLTSFSSQQLLQKLTEGIFLKMMGLADAFYYDIRGNKVKIQGDKFEEENSSSDEEEQSSENVLIKFMETNHGMMYGKYNKCLYQLQPFNTHQPLVIDFEEHYLNSLQNKKQMNQYFLSDFMERSKFVIRKMAFQTPEGQEKIQKMLFDLRLNKK